MADAPRGPKLRASPRLGWRRQGAGALLMMCGAALTGCGGDRHSAQLMPLRLLHAPPVAQMTAEELRSLSMDCAKYPQKGEMRGRYDAKYCDEATAAWSDSPLQMVTLPANPPPVPAAGQADP